MTKTTKTEIKTLEEPVLPGGRGPKEALLVPEDPQHFTVDQGTNGGGGLFGPLVSSVKGRGQGRAERRAVLSGCPDYPALAQQGPCPLGMCWIPGHKEAKDGHQPGPKGSSVDLSLSSRCNSYQTVLN